MPLKKLPFRKFTAKSPFSLKKLSHIGPYDTVTGPHWPILFPVWPASHKEVPTPELAVTLVINV